MTHPSKVQIKAESPGNDRGFLSKVEAQFTRNIFYWLLHKIPRNVQNSDLAILTPWVEELVAISFKTILMEGA